MFSIFRKSAGNKTPDLSGLRADMHSHLLPALDDGAKTTDDSLILIRGLSDLGYSKLITTPHIMSDIYPNNAETILPALNELRIALRNQVKDVEINAAGEYFFDDYFDNALAAGFPLLTISGNMVLVEFSFVSAPINAANKFFEMQIRGFQPVLAHPERYLYFSRNKSQFDEYKSMGVLFQVNLLSFTGYYGKPALEIANFLADKQSIDLLGTDMHHTRHLDTLRNAGSISGTIKKLLDSGKILNPGL
jgi:protein-tyrosine phosphatase